MATPQIQYTWGTGRRKTAVARVRIREGTGKWPEYNPDSLPAVIDIGIGCPTGVIFGTGFAPFRGGPLNYARTRGPENVASALRALAEKFGGRFTPDAGWDSFK